MITDTYIRICMVIVLASMYVCCGCVQSHTCPMTVTVHNAHPAHDLFVCFTKVMTLVNPSSSSTAKAAYSHQLIAWTEKTFHSTI